MMTQEEKGMVTGQFTEVLATRIETMGGGYFGLRSGMRSNDC